MKKLLTTGEVAELLGVSRLTVQRKFDKGEFWGSRHPVTGKRLISGECIRQFMEEHGLGRDRGAVPEKDVLVCSPDESLVSTVKEALEDDERISLEIVPNGADALIRCSAARRDLLIIDEELSDVHPAVVIKSLRRVPAGQDLKTLLFAHAESTGEYLNWGADACASKKGLTRDIVEASVYPLLQLVEPETASTEPIQHQRRWPRFPVKLAARLELYPFNRRQRRIPARGTVRNISQEGAYIAAVEPEGGVIPSEPFGVLLHILSAPLKSWQADCRVIRLQLGGSFGAGVEFVKVDPEDRKRLSALVK